MKWKTEEEIVIDNLQQQKETDETIRDNMGKFIRGHTLLGVRDKATGRFTVKPNMGSTVKEKVKQQPNIKNRHDVIALEVDRFLMVGVKD